MKRVVIAFLLPCLLWACSTARRMGVVELSVSTAQSAMTDGACPSRDRTQGYLDRIASP
jgi:hypothetical protein